MTEGAVIASPLYVGVGVRVRFEHWCREYLGMSGDQAEKQRRAVFVGDKVDIGPLMRASRRKMEIVDLRDDTTMRWVEVMDAVTQFVSTSNLAYSPHPAPWTAPEHYAYRAVSWEEDICPTCTQNDLQCPVFWPCPASRRDMTVEQSPTVPIAVRVATIQVVLPYRGEDDGDQMSEVMGSLVDSTSNEILDWRYLRMGGQYLSPTTQTAEVTMEGGHYIEGSAFK